MSSLPAGTPIILFCLDNSSFLAASEEGGLAPISKCVPEDNGYHVKGALVVAPECALHWSGIPELNSFRSYQTKISTAEETRTRNGPGRDQTHLWEHVEQVLRAGWAANPVHSNQHICSKRWRSIWLRKLLPPARNAREVSPPRTPHPPEAKVSTREGDPLRADTWATAGQEARLPPPMRAADLAYPRVTWTSPSGRSTKLGTDFFYLVFCQTYNRLSTYSLDAIVNIIVCNCRKKKTMCKCRPALGLINK